MFIDGYKSYMLHSDSPMVVSDSQCNNLKHPFDTLLTAYMWIFKFWPISPLMSPPLVPVIILLMVNKS